MTTTRQPQLRQNANLRATPKMHGRKRPGKGRSGKSARHEAQQIETHRAPHSVTRNKVISITGKSLVKNGEISDVLRELAERIGAGQQQDEHTLGHAVQQYREARVRPGLLKPASIRATNAALAVASSRWGALPVASTDWRIEAADYCAEVNEVGQRAWRVLTTLRAVLIHAKRQGWRSGSHGLDDLIARQAYRPRETVYTAEEVGRICQACVELDQTHPRTVPSRAVIRMIALTGCRVGEIVSLREEDIRKGCLRLRDSKTGPRSVPVSKEAIAIAMAQAPRNGWVFPGMTSHVSRGTVAHEFRFVREHAGIREGTPHTLRHSWATIAIRAGVPLQVVQRVLGHSTAWMTARYVHVAGQDTRVACALVAQAIGGGRDA